MGAPIGNQNAVGNKGGPLKFATVEELEKAIDAYFDLMGTEDRPYTVTGLAYHLDTTRETLLKYERKHVEYADTVRRAKLAIHNYAEESLWKSGLANGMKFNLQNNWGWKERVIQEQIQRTADYQLDEDERDDIREALEGVGAIDKPKEDETT